MSERDANRAAHPEFAEAVDFLRSRGLKIDAAWIEDADGIVVAGRRPIGVIDEVWVDSEKLEQMRVALAYPARKRR